MLKNELCLFQSLKIFYKLAYLQIVFLCVEFEYQEFSWLKLR